jgi:LysR family transcriptional regulator, glycine cleavage system transcriptional activator
MMNVQQQLNAIHLFDLREPMRQLPGFFSLRAFEAAGRLESFALAADELALTRSAVSHQIRALEEYFGRALFIRRNRRVEVTPEGHRLLGQLSRAFDQIEAACAELKPVASNTALAVHSSPSFASKWLGPRLPDFMQNHPSIIIRMSSSADPLDLMQHPELDICIAYGTAHPRAGVTWEPLGSEIIAPLCSPRLLEAYARDDRERITTLTLIDSQLNPLTWADWFALNGLVLNERPRASFDRAALAISAAVDGLGVALESTRFAEQELKAGSLVQLGAGIFKPLLRETHFLGYRSAQRKLEKNKAFRDWLFQNIGK